MPICDTALRFAQRDLYAPRWSDAIIEEAQRNLIDSGKWNPERIRRRFQLIREVFADSEVAGYESLVDLMRCHPKDRHVLAAAVWGNVDQIVTFNQKDFPEGAVTPYGIEVVSPDDFLLNVLDMFPRTAVEVIKEQAADLRKPPMSVDEVIAALSKCGVPEFAQTVDNIIRASD
jgi:hypothetical protein